MKTSLTLTALVQVTLESMGMVGQALKPVGELIEHLWDELEHEISHNWSSYHGVPFRGKVFIGGKKSRTFSTSKLIYKSSMVA